MLIEFFQIFYQENVSVFLHAFHSKSKLYMWSALKKKCFLATDMVRTRKMSCVTQLLDGYDVPTTLTG